MSVPSVQHVSRLRARVVTWRRGGEVSPYRRGSEVWPKFVSHRSAAVSEVKLKCKWKRLPSRPTFTAPHT